MQGPERGRTVFATLITASTGEDGRRSTALRCLPPSAYVTVHVFYDQIMVYPNRAQYTIIQSAPPKDDPFAGITLVEHC